MFPTQLTTRMGKMYGQFGAGVGASHVKPCKAIISESLSPGAEPQSCGLEPSEVLQSCGSRATDPGYPERIQSASVEAPTEPLPGPVKSTQSRLPPTTPHCGSGISMRCTGWKRLPG